MQDLCHEMNTDGLFVLSVKNNDLVPVEGMESAILVSLFTDQRLDESQMDIPINRGGWFGNVLTPNRELGSKLWAYENVRVSSGLMGNIRDCAKRSFDWMNKDNLTRKISVTVTPKGQQVHININLTARGDKVGHDYAYLWRKTKKREYNYA